MVWTTLNNADSQALYLQINDVELRGNRSQPRYAIQAITGHERGETEVLIEVAEDISVTFIDEWLEIENFRAFMAVCDRAEVETALEQLVRGMSFCSMGAGCSDASQSYGDDHDGQLQMFDGGVTPHLFRSSTVIAEDKPAWRTVA